MEQHTSPPPVWQQSSGERGVPPAFAFGEAFIEGWDSLRRNYGVLLLVTIVYVGISFGLNVAQRILGHIEPLAALLAFPITILVMPHLWAGAMWAGARAFRKEPVSVEDLFAGFASLARYGRVLGIAVLTHLIALAIVVPAAVIVVVAAVAVRGVPELALVVGLVLGVAAFAGVLYVWSRLWLALTVPLDPHAPDVGVIECMKLSWRMTGELKWLSLIAVAIVTALLLVVTFAACLLPGIFLGFPLMITVWGASYAMLAGEVGIWPGSQKRLCPSCGYDMSGLGICPECGGVVR